MRRNHTVVESAVTHTCGGGRRKLYSLNQKRELNANAGFARPCRT